MITTDDSLEDFSEMLFTHDGATKTVYRLGKGPAVIVMHEVPGITPEVARFARIVADSGFTVFAPSLFGTPGKAVSASYAVKTLARVCVSKEFSVLAARASSPVTDWLRALCRHAHGEMGGRGVGAIGMCMTGNFALSLMVDESVMAPVLSQPSLPLGVIGKSRRRGLHISDADFACVKARAAKGVTVLGLRFTGDALCPGDRFTHLRDELGPGFEGIEIDSMPGNPARIPITAHSVVTNDLVDREGHPTKAALDRVIGFFRERLIAAA
jgi:dienelactone hydrolase